MKNTVLGVGFLIGVLITNLCFSQDQISKEALIEVINYTTSRINRSPDNSMDFASRGWAFHCLDSLDDALADYNAAIKLDGKNSDFYFRRAEVKFDMTNYTDAIDDYNIAIELAEENMSYYISRGVAFEKTENYKLALADYNRVLGIETYNELALRNRAILNFLKFDEYELSLIDWQNLIKKFPKAEYYGDRGWLLIKIKKYEEAVKDFEMALRLDNNNIDYLVKRGFSYGLLGNYSKSLSDFAAAETIDKRYKYIYQYRGEILYQKGDKNNACLNFKTAINLGISIDDSKYKCF